MTIAPRLVLQAVRLVGVYRPALEERTRERVPLKWAMTQYNLGLGLEKLGKREDSTARLEEAVVAWESCLTVMASAWPRSQIEEVHSHIDRARDEIARRTAK
jgi:hypothetical protein